MDAALALGGYLEASYDVVLDAYAPERGTARASKVEETVGRILRNHRGKWLPARRVRDLWPWSGSNRPTSRELRSAMESMDGVEQKQHGRWTFYRYPHPPIET